MANTKFAFVYVNPETHPEQPFPETRGRPDPLSETVAPHMLSAPARPRNGFMISRTALAQEFKRNNVSLSPLEVTRLAREQWTRLETRQKYEQMAEAERAMYHAWKRQTNAEPPASSAPRKRKQEGRLKDGPFRITLSSTFGTTSVPKRRRKRSDGKSDSRLRGEGDVFLTEPPKLEEEEGCAASRELPGCSEVELSFSPYNETVQPPL
jgi:hypothetical protein